MRKSFVMCLGLAVGLCGLAHASSQQDKNKKLAQSFFEEVLDHGKLDRYAASHARDFVAHGDGRDYSLEEDMAAAREERQALPDMRVAVNQIVAERDLVAVYWTASGTNTQAGMGFPATGKKIRTTGMTLFRFKAGKISEEWSVWDQLSVLKQAGLFPTQP
jgi:steroid delta-isomerase-like uncharacterized protein